MVQFAQKPRHSLSFRSAALSREESATSLLAASRFLADGAGFGMTRSGVVLAQLHHCLVSLYPAFSARPKLFPLHSDPKAMTVISITMLVISNAARAQGYPNGLRSAYTTLLTGAATRIPNW